MMDGRPGGCPPRAGSRLLAIGAAVCLMAGTAAAQGQGRPPDVAGLSLEELLALEVDVVYGASRYQQKVSEAPASVTVITADELESHGYRTLADVLAATPGIHVTNDRNYRYLGLRGFGRPGDFNARVLLLVNGHRLNDNVYDQAFIGTEFPIEVSLIDRLEIIRGPNSSLYGTNAFLAVVNIITRTALQLPRLSVSAAGGSLGTRAGQVTASRAGARGPAVLLSASLYDSDGQARWYDPAFAVDGGDGVARNADGDRATRIFAALDFRGLSVQAVHGARRKHVPTANYGTAFGDSRFATEDTRSYVNAQYRAVVSGYTITGRAFADSYEYHADYPYDSETGSRLNVDDSIGHWWGTEAWLTSPPGRPHRWSLGAELVRHTRQDQRNGDEGGPPILDDRRASTDWGVYGQAHARVQDAVAVDLSLRFDRRGSQRGTLSPRTAIVVDAGRGTTVKALWGRVFRYPNAYEQYYQDLDSQKVNPNLDPERVNTWEVVVDRRVASRLRVAAGVYLSRFDDLIDTALDPSDGLVFFQNLHAVTARGVELEAEAKNGRGQTVGRASYSAQWTTSNDGAPPLSNAPRHLLKIGAGGALPWWKLSAAGQVNYTSRRFTVAGSRTRMVLLANANLVRRDVVRGLDASLDCDNLFDRRYSDPVSGSHVQDAISQDGRTLMLRLTYRLLR